MITRNGRPEAVIISVADLETLEETLDLLSTPGALDEIRTAEAQIARGEAIGADELRRLAAERIRTCRLSLRATRRLPSHLPDGGAYPDRPRRTHRSPGRHIPAVERASADLGRPHQHTGRASIRNPPMSID